MNNTLLRPWLAVLLASWIMVACGGGGSALGVGGSSSSSTTTAIVGEDGSPADEPDTQGTGGPTSTGDCSTSGRMVLREQDSPRGVWVSMSYENKEVVTDDNSRNTFTFLPKLDANQQPVNCTFTIDMPDSNGGLRDALVEPGYITMYPIPEPS